VTSFNHNLQTWIVKDYPAELMLTLLACVVVTIQSTIVALIVEKDVNAWKLKPDIELMTIVYSVSTKYRECNCLKYKS